MKDFFGHAHPKQEKEKKISPPGRFVLKGVSSILILLLIILLIFQGRKIIFSPLERVNIHGNSILSKETVVQYLELNENDSWLKLDPYALSIRLKRHLWVKSAIVHRNLSLGLDVYITERKPVAYLKVKNDLFFLCQDNLVLRIDKINPGDWNLPVVVTNTPGLVKEGTIYRTVGVDRALELIEKLKNNPVLNTASISEINIDDPLNMELVTLPHGIRIKLGYRNLEEKIKNLSIAMPTLEKMKKSIQYIDLRHNNGVVLKKK